jgi:hypothetical protein
MNPNINWAKGSLDKLVLISKECFARPKSLLIPLGGIYARVSVLRIRVRHCKRVVEISGLTREMKPLVVHASTHGSFKSHGGSVASFNNLTTSLPTFDSPPPSPPPPIPEVELKMFWIWRKVVIREKKEERNGNGSMNIELNKVERSLEKILRKFVIGPYFSRNQISW